VQRGNEKRVETGEEEWKTEEDVEECADKDTEREEDIQQQEGTQKSVQKRTQKVMYSWVCLHSVLAENQRIQLLQYVTLPVRDLRQALPLLSVLMMVISK